MSGQPAPGETSGLQLGPSAARQLEVCVHCGFCLPVCPTYRVLGEEADSPRGRIDIIAGARAGSVGLQDPELSLHLDRCLDCRACESACPSGVRYHELLEAAVAQLPARRPWTAASGAADGEGPAFSAGWRMVHFGLRRLLRHPRLLSWGVRLAPRLAALGRVVPPGVGDVLAGLPHPGQAPARGRLPGFTPAARERRGAVDLFLGCVQDAVFGEDNVAIARVLSVCGYDVHVVQSQGCCGALHQHTGRKADVVELAAANIRAFGDSQRPVIVGSGGCSAVLKDYGRLLADSPLAAEAAALAARVRDFSEFLAEAPRFPEAMPPPGAPVRVTYHDPCHLAHAQGVRAQPRRLLRDVPGVEFIELAEADSCCGSAGVYNLLEPELAGRVLERKIENVTDSGADWVVTCNAGCALQLRTGIARAGLSVRVLSLGQFLAEVYGGGAA